MSAPALVRAFAESVLGWSFSPKGYAGTAESPIPAELEVNLPDYGETLRPDFAVREMEPRQGTVLWQLLVQVIEPGEDFDQVTRKGGQLEASAHGRTERLFRQTGVPAGLLFNGRALRLVSAPRGESSGWVDFRVSEKVQTAGRPICTAMRLLLGEPRLLSLPRGERLATLLEDSRRFQIEVASVSPSGSSTPSRNYCGASRPTDISKKLERVAELSEALRLTFCALAPTTDDEGRGATPLRIERLRRLLLIRLADPAAAASDSYFMKRAIAGILCTRAIMETVAVACRLEGALGLYLAEGDRAVLEADVRRLEFGNRMKDAEDAPQALNVLTLIDRVEAHVPAYRMAYDLLSEMCHPNWSGVFGSYSRETEGGMKLGMPGFDSRGMRTGLLALEMALTLVSGTITKLELRHREVLWAYRNSQEH